MNKIRTKVSRETNYIYHMLSVSKCGYDNDYGNTYLSKHSADDLMMLKENEALITVKGGEHCGKLYHWLVSVPASLDIEAIKQYNSVHALFLPTAEPDFADKVNEFYRHYSQFAAVVPNIEYADEYRTEFYTAGGKARF